LLIIEGTESVYEIEKIIIHERYGDSYGGHDIALLKLTRDLQYSAAVRKICLPDSPPPEGVNCVAIGWGDTQGQTVLCFCYNVITHSDDSDSPLTQAQHHHLVGYLNICLSINCFSVCVILCTHIVVFPYVSSIHSYLATILINALTYLFTLTYLLGIGRLSAPHVCVYVTVSIVRQKHWTDISSSNLAGGQYVTSPGHPFYLRSEG